MSIDPFNYEPYRPANASEGEAFYNAYCKRCVHEQAHIKSDGYEDGCDILADSMLFAIESAWYPEALIWIAGKGACCNGFELAPDATPPRCSLTADLFAVAR